MLFVSRIIGRLVVDDEGEVVGRVSDLLALKRDPMPHPQLVALKVDQRRQSLLISINDVAVLTSPTISLNIASHHISPYIAGEHELYLVKDILDKQIIDTNGIRVVRVNDLELKRVNGDFYIANVDISGAGLMRRFGFDHLPSWLSPRLKSRESGVISWDNVEVLSHEQPMRLKVSSEKISDLHPADLAEILSDLTLPDGNKLLETLDVKTLADTLEEVEPDFQASLVEEMPNEKVADVLEEMAPDEAADLLAELPDDRSKKLLDMMEIEDAADVRKLLAYPENTAGGIMNTEFVTVPPDLTITQAINFLRKVAQDAETIYYIFVTDSEGHLQGVFSLRQLVLSQPHDLVRNIMEQRVISVNLLDSQDDCAQVISKYNLLAVPVVDDQNCMHGIVTADDALDKIIPTAWKKRLPKLHH